MPLLCQYIQIKHCLSRNVKQLSVPFFPLALYSCWTPEWRFAWNSSLDMLSLKIVPAISIVQSFWPKTYVIKMRAYTSTQAISLINKKPYNTTPTHTYVYLHIHDGIPLNLLIHILNFSTQTGPHTSHPKHLTQFYSHTHTHTVVPTPMCHWTPSPSRAAHPCPEQNTSVWLHASVSANPPSLSNHRPSPFLMMPSPRWTPSRRQTSAT